MDITAFNFVFIYSLMIVWLNVLRTHLLFPYMKMFGSFLFRMSTP